MAKKDNSLGDGVYFAKEDYIGIGKRIVIIIVDLGVIAFAVILSVFLAAVFSEEAASIVAMLNFPLAWFYLTFVKASPMRTLGLRLTDARIVTLRGKRPSTLRMTLRLFLWGFGPFNLLFDMIWMGIDQDRQTPRDRFASTYMIRNRAQPIGEGSVHLARFLGGGFALMYPQVIRPAEADAQT